LGSKGQEPDGAFSSGPAGRQAWADPSAVVASRPEPAGHPPCLGGLDQVSAYARRLGRDEGYLVIFDTDSRKPWGERGRIEERPHAGVRVVVLRT